MPPVDGIEESLPAPAALRAQMAHQRKPSSAPLMPVGAKRPGRPRRRPVEDDAEPDPRLAACATRIQAATRGFAARRQQARQRSQAGGTMVPVPGTGTAQGAAGWYQRDGEVFFMQPEPGGFHWVALAGPYREREVRQMLARAATDAAPWLTQTRPGGKPLPRRRLDRCATAIQAAARGHLARVALLRSRSAASGVMLAVAATGTQQGKEGWYQTGPHAFYALPMASGEWLMLQGPLPDARLRRNLAQLRLRTLRWHHARGRRAALAIQAAVRGHMTRRALARLRCREIAQETGMLSPVGGTRQGQRGWYQHEDAVYFMRPCPAEPSGWERLVGPVSVARWQRLTMRGVAIACIGTAQGAPGRYLDTMTGTIASWAVVGGQWRCVSTERTVLRRAVSAPAAHGGSSGSVGPVEAWGFASSDDGPTVASEEREGWLEWLAAMIWGPSTSSSSTKVEQVVTDELV